MLDESLKHIDDFAAAITLADRARVIEAVQRVSADDAVTAETRAKLDKVRVAMLRQDCTAICAN